MDTPVYLFTGLLESGKTTLIQEVAAEEGFLEPGKTVLLQCEEGETEFDEEFLTKYDMALITIDDEDEINENLWSRIASEYHPTQIMIEYNGMWKMDTLEESNMPMDWYVGGIYSTVDTTRADLYIDNMRKTFMECLKLSNLVIFNRCGKDVDRLRYRRIIKGLNPAVQIAFEGIDGEIFENDEDLLPFDYEEETIVIEDMDYGLWYLDAIDHPDRYIGKKITFTAKFCANMNNNDKIFVPGRHIMTCCEDDIQFLGFICTYNKDIEFDHEDWVQVTVKFGYQYMDLYEEEGPVLELIDIKEGVKPEQELVTLT